MTWAKDGKDEKLVKAAKENKLPIPAAILNRPILHTHDLLYWECFMDLCTTRQMGGGMGYISWSAVHAWALRHELADTDEFEELRYVVQKMDEFWVDHFRQGKT